MREEYKNVYKLPYLCQHHTEIRLSRRVFRKLKRPSPRACPLASQSETQVASLLSGYRTSLPLWLRTRRTYGGHVKSCLVLQFVFETPSLILYSYWLRLLIHDHTWIMWIAGFLNAHGRKWVPHSKIQVSTHSCAFLYFQDWRIKHRKCKVHDNFQILNCEKRHWIWRTVVSNGFVSFFAFASSTLF